MGYGTTGSEQFNDEFDIDNLIRHVLTELKKARTKFPGNKWQFAAFMEEVGELSQALMEHSRTNGEHEKYTEEFIKKELYQVITMAMRIYLEGSHEFKYKNPNFKP